jgi:hypothetical protein
MEKQIALLSLPSCYGIRCRVCFQRAMISTSCDVLVRSSRLPIQSQRHSRTVESVSNPVREAQEATRKPYCIRVGVECSPCGIKLGSAGSSACEGLAEVLHQTQFRHRRFPRLRAGTRSCIPPTSWSISSNHRQPKTAASKWKIRQTTMSDMAIPENLVY